MSLRSALPCRSTPPSDSESSRSKCPRRRCANEPPLDVGASEGSPHRHPDTRGAEGISPKAYFHSLCPTRRYSRLFWTSSYYSKGESMPTVSDYGEFISHLEPHVYLLRCLSNNSRGQWSAGWRAAQGVLGNETQL